KLRKPMYNAVEMARRETARIDVDLEISDVREIVDDVVASMRGEIDDRAIEIVRDEPVPPIPFDRRLVKLAIKQLVDNAVKYSHPRSPVTIRVHSANGRVLVDITDRGEGVPPQDQSRIFERFYRSPAVKHQAPGAGLGLSIAHRIVEAPNGAL